MLVVCSSTDGSVHALESERFEAFKHTELVPSPYFWLAYPPLNCQELHIFDLLWPFRKFWTSTGVAIETGGVPLPIIPAHRLFQLLLGLEPARRIYSGNATVWPVRMLSRALKVSAWAR